MLRSTVIVWLLALFSTGAFAFTTPSCEDAPQAPFCTTSNTSTKTKANNAASTAATGSAASTTQHTAVNGGSGGSTANGGSTRTAGAAQTINAQSSVSQPSGASATENPSRQGLTNDSTSGGLGSTEKIGIGVGVGVGVPLIAGAIALFFILRRRKSNNRYGSANSSAAQLQDQPAMSSAAPALAGVSAMGRSSKHSLPQTPSQHSLEDVRAPPPPVPAPMIQPPSSHSLARAPSQHSIATSLPEQENLMPAPPPYEDAPSPMAEHPERPVSPVSPISPMGSRPPSPLNEHDRL